MPKRHLTKLVLPLIGLGIWFPAHPSLAETLGGADGESDGSGTVTATARTRESMGGSVSAGNSESDSAPARPRCSWSLAHVESAGIDSGGPVGIELGEVASYRDAESKESVAAPGAGIEALYWVTCDGQQPQLRWAAPPEFVDRQALIDAAYAEARARVPMPSVNMNPPPEVGGVVNLGLWLAVDDPGQVNALASVGSVWASVTARFVGMSWNMGTGPVVNCDGLGTPYPQGSNQVGEGPCGFTYTDRPPLDGYSVSAVGHWVVQLVTSDGVNRMLDPIDMTFEFAYDVDEVVTTGEAWADALGARVAT